MGFGMIPATNWPVPTPDDFPTFIQFQEDGVNLGGPDASTVNFSTGLVATRGEGESADIITVTASGGGGGGAATAVFLIAGATTDEFDSTRFSDWSPATTALANAIATWDDTGKALSVAAAGTYAVKIECKVTATVAGNPVSFPRDDIIYGAEVDHSVISTRTQLGFNSSALGLDNREYVQWVEDFTVQTSAADVLVQPRIYCKCYSSNDGKDATFSAVVTITKLS